MGVFWGVPVVVSFGLDLYETSGIDSFGLLGDLLSGPIFLDRSFFFLYP